MKWSNRVAVDTIKNSFAKCGITAQLAEENDGKVDEEFAIHVKELRNQIDNDPTTGFDAVSCTVEPAFDSDQVDWTESRNACIADHLRGPTEVVDFDDGNDDESMKEEIPDFRISPREALVLLNKIICTTGIDAEDCESLGELSKNLERFVINTKKQASIISFFLLVKNIQYLRICCFILPISPGKTLIHVSEKPCN